MNRRDALATLAALGGLALSFPARAGDSPQPVLEGFARLTEALARAGEPFPASPLAQIERLIANGQLDDAARAALELLSLRVLLEVSITAEARVSVRRRMPQADLIQGGWRLYLVRVLNPALVPGKLGASSPQALPPFSVGDAPPTTRGDAALRWLSLDVHDIAPLDALLDPEPVSFKILRLYARDAGRRSAVIAMDIGVGTGDIGGRDRVAVGFDCRPARQVRIGMLDHDGTPVTGSLKITDAQGRVLPSPTHRAPPDMFFQHRIYRADGQTVLLPAGDYTVEYGRGPEYLLQTQKLHVPAATAATTARVAAAAPVQARFRLQRWTDPAARGWLSGDHHIHAAGCAHYTSPEEGVGAESIAPQVRGEGLAIASVLTWAPGFYHQKLNFTGSDNAESSAAHRIHYDLEVSGFPSSHCGHLALLRMKAMDYPDTNRVQQWPSSNAPVLRWAREQGAVTGYAHAGVGLWAGSAELPNYRMPAFDGIGANDYIVTLPEGLVDFLSVCNNPPAGEMTIWYHTLNCGLRSRIAGETDWPCFFEESVGMGRSYVKLDGPLEYGAWCEGLRRGRSYVSEGRAHLLDFRVNGVGVGGADVALAAPGEVTVEVDFVARLAPQMNAGTEALRALAPLDKPYWHIERARIGATRSVALELVVNGRTVQTLSVPADEAVHSLRFNTLVDSSCWIALRVMNAAHTNPVWVDVGGRPVAVKRSAQWCRDAVDVCWNQKVKRIREGERAEEAALYDRARRFYERLLKS